MRITKSESRLEDNPYSPQVLLNVALDKKEQIKSTNNKIKFTKKAKDAYLNYKFSQSLDNLRLETLGIEEHFRSYYIQLVNDLIYEYKCTKPSEKMIVNTIASSYIRILEVTKTLQGVLTLAYAKRDLNQYYALLSKELDRAHKQYQESMKLLVLMKQTPVQVKVNAQNAIIGTNQQLNVVQKDKLS